MMNFKEIHVLVLILAKFSFSQKNDQFLNEINALIKWAILLSRREKNVDCQLMVAHVAKHSIKHFNK